MLSIFARQTAGSKTQGINAKPKNNAKGYNRWGSAPKPAAKNQVAGIAIKSS